MLNLTIPVKPQSCISHTFRRLFRENGRCHQRPRRFKCANSLRRPQENLLKALGSFPQPQNLREARDRQYFFGQFHSVTNHPMLLWTASSKFRRQFCFRQPRPYPLPSTGLRGLKTSAPSVQIRPPPKKVIFPPSLEIGEVSRWSIWFEELSRMSTVGAAVCRPRFARVGARSRSRSDRWAPRATGSTGLKPENRINRSDLQRSSAKISDQILGEICRRLIELTHQQQQRQVCQQRNVTTSSNVKINKNKKMKV